MAKTRNASPSQVALDIPPRRMWDREAGSDGYCGETSFQMSLLHHGAHTSGEVVHRADGNSELLIGTGNDTLAAETLLLRYEIFTGQGSGTDPEESLAGRFLPPGVGALTSPEDETVASWIKRNIDRGATCAIGLLGFHGEKDEYDHIMICVGYEGKEEDETFTALFYDLYEMCHYHVPAAGEGHFRTRDECVEENRPASMKKFESGWSFPDGTICGIALLGLLWDPQAAPDSLKSRLQPLVRRVSVHIPYEEEPECRPEKEEEVDDWGSRKIKVKVSSPPTAAKEEFSLVALSEVASARAFASILLGKDQVPKAPKREPTMRGSKTSDKKQNSSAPAARVITKINANSSGEPLEVEVELDSSETVYFVCIASSFLENNEDRLASLFQSPPKSKWADDEDDGDDGDDDEDDDDEEDDDDDDDDEEDEDEDEDDD